MFFMFLFFSLVQTIRQTEYCSRNTHKNRYCFHSDAFLSVILFSDIADNILYIVNLNLVYNCLAHNININLDTSDIEQLQWTYQFKLSEGGMNLSGRQRQRIARPYLLKKLKF